MWLIRPKRIRKDNRARVAKIIQAARRNVRRFVEFNPTCKCGVRVIWRGYGYIAKCQYFDTFTGSPCTFNIAFEGDI